MNASNAYDVVVVGAGPAGLSGALVLGRCRRRVLVLDDGLPRNAPSHAVHGFLTCDGSSPAVLRQLALAQLEPYDVAVHTVHVASATREANRFVLSAPGELWTARKVLLATGVRDRWSDIPGVGELAGAGVYQCPYCHGWEVRDQLLGVYAPCPEAAELALGLKTWSPQVVLFTGGAIALEASDSARLERHDIRSYESPLVEVSGRRGRLEGVRLESGELVRLDALFIHAGQEPRNTLAVQLGCELEQNGTIRVGPKQQTNVPGLFVAGDLAVDTQAVAVAVAEGYKAGVAINRELREDELG